MQGRLWQFNSILFSLKPFDGYTRSKMEFNTKVFWVQMHDILISCMNEVMAHQIGSTVGIVHDCDACDDGMGWEKYLRVLIELNLSLPITRGLTINVKGNILWILFNYENLPKLCFRYGKFSHDSKLCAKDVSKLNEGTDQFGVWLRVDRNWKNSRFKSEQATSLSIGRAR